ncbi:MAG TPA: GNAT family N-acetyltransferase [Candidatus Limnocylindria bacterium]|jgi:GNAT superfamily N-acetyltransferase
MRDVVVKELSPALHDELMHFFDVIAFADNPHWAKCFCMFPLATSGQEYEATTKEQNRARRSAVIRSGSGNGLVAFRLGRVVGWCHAAPKPELPILGSPDGWDSSDRTTGAVMCFIVAPDARRQGVATALLDAACEYMRRRGMTAMEAYPPLQSPDDPVLWPRRNERGPLSMFEKAGFREVSRDEWQITVRRDL